MVFRILQWNIKGLINNFNELNILIKERNPSVIALQETHCAHNFNPFPPKGYHGYFFNSPSNSSSKQGVGLLIKENIPHKQIIVNQPIQAVGIDIQMQIKLKIISIYLPPQETIIEKDLTDLMLSLGPNAIVLGDINSWNTLWGSSTTNRRGQIVEEALSKSQLCILNHNKPTHFSTHSTYTSIDISCCSLSLLPFSSWEILDDLHSSDHYPILVDFSFLDNQSPKKTSSIFLLNQADWSNFSKRVEVENHSRTLIGHSNRDAAAFAKSIRVAANLYIPQSKPTKKRYVPWWNDNLTILRKEKMICWQNFKKQPTAQNLAFFKKANSKFRREVKNSKSASFEAYTKTINRNSSLTHIWQKINTLSGKNTRREIEFIKKNDKIISDNKEIVEYFAHNWASYSDDINFCETYRNKKSTFFQTLVTKATNHHALLIEEKISETELSASLSKVKGKTPGIDRISYKMLKALSPHSRQQLLSLYNTVLTSGVIPQSWKVATIIPIPKSNKNIEEIKSYRPISLISCLSKLLEKIVATRLQWFCEARKLISTNQVGFKSNRGCADALLHIDYLASKALSSRNHLTILSLDFEKAFERIGAHIILNCLKDWGIGPIIFNYIKSFLSNRRFKVKINNDYSKIHPLHNGIPQGSPLSVILFQIAFNEVSKIVLKHKHIEHCLYADDMYLISRRKSDLENDTTLKNVLIDILAWSESSGARISFEKTKKMHICRKHKCKNKDSIITIDNHAIAIVNKLRILGIIFSSKYNWKEHCTVLKNSLSKRVNLICYLSQKSHIHVNTLINLTKTLILSKIDYGLFLYGRSAKSILNIFRSQYHAAARASTYAFRTTPINNILAEGGFPKIEDRVVEIENKLASKLPFLTNSVIDAHIETIQKTKRTIRIPSALHRTLKLISQLNINIVKPYMSRYPPWKIKPTSCDIELSNYKKEFTSSDVYTRLFLEKRQIAKQNNWQLIYTDGSKTGNENTSYAVVNEQGTTLINKHLNEFCTVFTAEALAIYQAALVAKKTKTKTMICTDSLSVMRALLTPYVSPWQTVNKIKDLLIANENMVKILWVPSHCFIAGNELADSAAKYACKAPIFLDSTIEKNDLRKFFIISNKNYITSNWNQYQHHHYKDIMNTYKTPVYPLNVSKERIKAFIRFRLGHITATHQHILRKENQPKCTRCNQIFCFEHLTRSSCATLAAIKRKHFGTETILDILKIVSEDNINKLYEFVTTLKITV